MTSVTLGDVVKVRGRFHRSVQLYRDWRDQCSLSEYLLTPTARELALQILKGIQTPYGVKAWSITGPYGTGKSAFALFLTDLLTQVPPDHRDARELRRELGFQAMSFVPILIVGQRASLIRTFLAALAEGLTPIIPSLAQEVRKVARLQHIPDVKVVALVEQAAQAVRQAGHGGLLIVLDEFGKFLEYTSLHPEVEDLLVMQHLAETAVRSPAPILLMTILHTSFAEYLRTSDEVQRMEWQKVQGRFVDVAFQEPTEQLLRLVGAAIQRQMPCDLEDAYLEATDQVIQSSSLREARYRFPVEEFIQACVPLHPIVALLLWPLFRSKLAQNERSLFAFLTGHEPFGFQEFLSFTVWDQGQPSFYRVNHLYDYVTTALGAAIYTGDRARRWAEIDNALSRVSADAPLLSQAVIKAVGLIGLYGKSVGLKASKDTIMIALDDSEGVSDALVYLEHASILVYRRHEGAYGLWEGSDVDLETCIEEARCHVGQGSLAVRLKEVAILRPIVARAHYIKTGTLRYFTVDIIDGTEQNLRKALKDVIAPADGQILYVLTPSLRDRKSLIGLAKILTGGGMSECDLRILAFPKPIVGLEEALREVEIWKWIIENIQALQGDTVARQEVRSHLLQARDRLESIAGHILGLEGELFDPTASEWVQGATLQTSQSAREFLQWLSVLCDNIFDQAPALHNELLNRNRLSSAAAKARRNLLEAMLTREEEPNLGFIGTPAEVSMYKALIAAGGFHRIRDDQLRFGEPDKEWQPVWRQICQFLETTQTSRHPINELFAVLRQPPFGLREGPLPVLLCAVLLAHRDDVALYEDGTFVPELRIEIFERLLRVPEAFEIQQYALASHDREAFMAVSEVIETLQLLQDQTIKPHLLQIVKPLVVFAARLPVYTKNTRRIDPPQATAVRDALLRARDPYTLMFVDLSMALGMSSNQGVQAPIFAQRLKECLIGLQRAYPRLLDEIEIQLREVFDLRGTSEEARRQLHARATPLNGYATDRTLTLFVREASHLDGRDWRENLARVVNGGTPPHQWHDADVVTFQIRLRQLASDFVRLEELVAEQRLTGATQILRIGLLDGHVQESREVIAITPERAPAIESLASHVIALLEQDTDHSEESCRIRLAALAQVAARYLQHPGRTNGE